MTVAEALRHAARRLTKAGVAYPDLDAELLLRHVTDWDRARVLTESESELLPGLEARFLALVEGRARRRPLQHLVGSQHFWRHEFLVTPDVLIPRPESEILVETALELLREAKQPLIVDVGTGCGCLALSLAAERPDALVHAVDLSSAALDVARRNARRLGLSERVRFQQGDLLEPLAKLAGRIDAVLCNPPYVAADEVGSLMPEVRDHEPRAALVPGEDAYAAYRRLAPQARQGLRAGGFLLVEVGQGMDAEAGQILASAGLALERTIPDLRAIPRALLARKPQ